MNLKVLADLRLWVNQVSLSRGQVRAIVAFKLFPLLLFAAQQNMLKESFSARRGTHRALFMRLYWCQLGIHHDGFIKIEIKTIEPN